jgi:soluble cytochrome b562
MLNELTEQARRRKSHIHLDDAEIKSHRDGLMYVMGELDAEIARRAKKGAR